MLVYYDSIFNILVSGILVVHPLTRFLSSSLKSRSTNRKYSLLFTMCRVSGKKSVHCRGVFESSKLKIERFQDYWPKPQILEVQQNWFKGFSKLDQRRWWPPLVSIQLGFPCQGHARSIYKYQSWLPRNVEETDR